MPLDVERVRRQFPGRAIIWKAATRTTMEEAARELAAGCAHGAVVGADEQSAGQGRQGRSWHSEAENGLYVSIVLRPSFRIGEFPAFTLAMGLAAREAIETACGVPCDLRWPNDILAGNKKCAGILLQLEGEAAIAGFGINVNHAAFPAGLEPTATSLYLEIGRRHSREDLLIGLLRAVDHYCDLMAREGAEPILRLFAQASSYTSGRRVVVESEEGTRSGVTAGLDAHGYLLLRQDNGVITRVVAGGVRPAAAPERETHAAGT